MTAADTLTHYTEPGPFTDPGAHRDALLTLPRDVGPLLDALHGLLIHVHLTWAYEVEHRTEHDETANLRAAQDILDRLTADGRPLAEAREPHERIAGTCRDFTLITVAVLRAHGVPARARCGFGAYFPVPTMEDHWVAEYWNADEQRWALADAQIDARQRELFKIDPAFDCTDVPRDQFLVAGEAWRRCRSGEDDPNRYGLHSLDEFGDWWIAGNLVRDAASLAGVEMLPWDVWGPIPEPEETIGPELLALFDHLADLTFDPDTAADVRAVYAEHERLQVAETVFNANRGVKEAVFPES
ncbi:transglutaminase-like domain-containing protein [Glycomyces harbinensis]|uniref:Transglutaminase-like superfamily protein n=1 Tax=Glycomyces harbinensis TaxID=58114 RepID=A0A1G7DY97_9ACTN|nr:transglutaminase-like domain-containing protein [Glycomyces harbinensis]SDE56220.1 Transglutaminase-like superfamily protein [Glycomyces harbinensis]